MSRIKPQHKTTSAPPPLSLTRKWYDDISLWKIAQAERGFRHMKRLRTELQPRHDDYKHSIKRILDDLVVLQNEDDSDGYIFKPSDYAFRTTWKFISNTYIELDTTDQLPRPFVSPDGRGGVRVEWTHGDRVVSLLCGTGPELQSYIYHAAGDEHGVSRQVSVDGLVMALRWLFHHE